MAGRSERCRVLICRKCGDLVIPCWLISASSSWLRGWSRKPGYAQPGYFLGRQASVGVGEDLAMLDADGLQEALLAERQRDEVPELDELWLSEVLVEAAPELVVGQAWVPRDGHRPGQRRTLTVIEALRRLEVQNVVDLRLRGALLPGQLGTLAAAVLA